MTFINREMPESKNIEKSNNEFSKNENEESSFFKKIIIVSIGLLVVIVAYFIINTLSVADKSVSIDQISNIGIQNTKTESAIKSNDISTILNTEIISNEIIVNESKTNEVNIALLKEVEENKIFQIASTNPNGYYVMVGSFSNYKNAIKLQKMNPTEFTCHIFEPNYNDLNRVGLFISKDKFRDAQNALKEIKNMNKQSWLLYNTKN